MDMRGAKTLIPTEGVCGQHSHRDSRLEVEDVSALGEDAQGAEDEILEPEEDCLAGQIAIMRGGTAKKRQAESDNEVDDIDTDGGQKSDNSSDSDSH